MILPMIAESRVLPLARVQRTRLLPQPGDVLVKPGEHVTGLDVVGRANAAQLRPIPLARYMRLKEATLQKHLEKLPGELLQERDVIASKPEYLGTLRRIYRAPGNGRFASLQGTWITIDLADKPVELRALYHGTVKNVLPHHGVVIEAVGAFIQSAWGYDAGYGPLKMVAASPETVTLEEHLDASTRDAILIAGAGVSNAAIRRAAEAGAQGLIVGSLRPGQIELVAAKKLPTLVTEGFGERAMSAGIFQLLSSHAGEEIAINASLPAEAMRPEAFIPAQPSSGGAVVGLPPAALPVRNGARVRLIAEPHLGETGKISAIVTAPQVLESGLSAWGAEIELNSGERLFVPWENLELIDI